MTLRKKILLLGFVAIAGICFALWRQYAYQSAEFREVESLVRSIEAVAALSSVAHELQRERGFTTFILAGANHPTTLAEEVERTDAAMARLLKTGRMPPGFDAALSRLRSSIGQDNRLPLVVRDDFSILLRTLMDEMSRLAHKPASTLADGDIAAHVNLVAMKEYLGQARATVVYWLTNPRDERRVFENLIRITSLLDEAWRKYELDASPALREAFRTRFTGPEVEATRDAISTMRVSGTLPPGLGALEWLKMATLSVDRLFEIESHSLQLIEAKAAHRLETLQGEMTRGTVVMLITALLVLTLTVSATVSLLKALQRTRSGMERIATTQDFQSRIPADSPDEIGHIARSFNALLEIAEQLLREKEQLAATDPLTGISNRLHFTRVLDEEAQRKRRNKTPMALLMFDIDHFKQVNDTHGHNTGDEALKHLARVVLAETRATDFFGRWGGEEFILLLRDDGCDAAYAIAEKLRRRIAAEEFPGGCGKLTCSFGVTAWKEEDTATSLVYRADRALYASKRHGRNRTTCDASLEEGCRGVDCPFHTL